MYGSWQKRLELLKFYISRSIGIDPVDEIFYVNRQPEVVLDYLH